MTRRPIIPDGPGAKQGTNRPETTEPTAGAMVARRGSPELVAMLLPVGVAVVGLLVAAGSTHLSPRGLLGSPTELVGWVLLGAVAALHRPLGGSSLGLGAIVVAPVALRHGAGPASLVAAATVAVAELGRRALAGRTGATPEAAGRLLPPLERALFTVPSVLVALAWPPGDRSMGSIAASIFLYLGMSAAFDAAVAHLGRRSFDPRCLLPFGLDALGWAVGAALAAGATAPGIGWQRGWMLWALVAALSAEAARNAMLRVRSEVRVDTFERLHEAHERILAETSGMGEIARQVLVECRNILPVQWFLFELPSEQDDDWVTSWAAGPDGLLVEGRPKPPPRPQTLPGIHRRAEWHIVERPLIGPSGADGDEATLARLRVWCDPRQIEPGASELFDTLVPQMASSVHRALLDREAKLDPLTGVPVRRVLEARLQRAFHRAHEDGTPMAVILCDIDFFKKVNDTHGHDAGDEALKLVATTLDENRRDDDLCCRYGGEEFTVLLERADGEAALGLAERLRRAIESLHLIYADRPIPLTLSLGVAAFPDLHVKTASELVLLADEALYAAKAGGRNQALLNIGHGSYRGVGRRQESSTTIARPQL
ncbi:MAG: GGDEF domain-containing protein [Acidobacteriota bacterium]